MAGRKWMPAEIAIAQTGRERGDDNQTIRGALADAGFGRSLSAVRLIAHDRGWHKIIVPAPFEIYNKAPHLDGDALVMADPHVPFHDADWCNRVITHALRRGIKQLILAGDFITSRR